MKKEPEFVTLRGRTEEAIAKGDLSESAYVTRKMRAILMWDLRLLDWRMVKMNSKMLAESDSRYMVKDENFINQETKKYYQELADKYQLSVDNVKFQACWRIRSANNDLDMVRGKFMRLISKEHLQEAKTLYTAYETSLSDKDKKAYDTKVKFLSELYEIFEDEIDWQRKYRRILTKS